MLSNCDNKTLESSMDSKIKQINPKGNQHWIFIGRTHGETEAPGLWTSDAKRWLIGKGPDAGKYLRLEEKGKTEDEMVGWHHWLNEFEQVPWEGEGLLQSTGSQRLICDWMTEKQTSEQSRSVLPGGGCGYDRAEGLLAIGDRGLVAVSLKAEVDGTDSDCFLDSILSWKYDPMILRG